MERELGSPGNTLLSMCITYACVSIFKRGNSAVSEPAGPVFRSLRGQAKRSMSDEKLSTLS